MKINIWIFLVLLLLSNNGYAVMPVVDADSILKMGEQIKQMEKQLSKMDRGYDAISGTRNLGNVSHDPQYRDYLPSNWEKTYDQISKGGYSGMTPNARQLHQQYKVGDACAHLKDREERSICEALDAKPAQDKAFTKEALEKSNSRIHQIERLMNQINNTNDPKAISELQARIAIEQTMLANEQMKINLYKVSSDNEDNIQYQREVQMIAKDAAKRGGMKLKPITFGNR